MEERRYYNPDKMYVGVKAIFYPDGGFEPISLLGEDGGEYSIDKVIDIRRAASLKAGGTGIRYTCRISGQNVYLFLEEDRWFMERR